MLLLRAVHRKWITAKASFKTFIFKSERSVTAQLFSLNIVYVSLSGSPDKVRENLLFMSFSALWLRSRIESVLFMTNSQV